MGLVTAVIKKKKKVRMGVVKVRGTKQSPRLKRSSLRS